MRTQFRAFADSKLLFPSKNAVESLKSTFCDKSAMLFIMEGMLYKPISQDMHALIFVLTLIDILSPFFHSFTATFLSCLGK